MKYKIILFQPYLRQHILNFGKRLKNFDFIYQRSKGGYSYALLPSFKEEIKRRKDSSWIVRIRRLLGIPNVRIKLTTQGDMLFTYGCLLLTNKPYATLIETGVALYNYDVRIARNPIARLIVSWLATRPNCKKLIFMSLAGMKSFFTTVRYSPSIKLKMQEKSVVIYPLIEKTSTKPKRFSLPLKLLFVGLFYMKGGLELVRAYQRLKKEGTSVSLTIVTPTRMLSPKDIKYFQSLPGLRLLDAKLSAEEMNKLYNEHDVFVLPTYREGFGLVVVEALAHAMPVIVTDQYSVAEMVEDKKNGFVFYAHPLKDYDPQTYELLGRYHNPRDFYANLFRFQKEGRLKPVEDFLVTSIKAFLDDPTLLEQFSKGSLSLYKRKFDAHKLSSRIEKVFLEAVNK